jgi:hypothetical protein
MTKGEDVKQPMVASQFKYGGMEIEGEEKGMKIGVFSDTPLIEPSVRFKKMAESHFKDGEKLFRAEVFVD